LRIAAISDLHGLSTLGKEDLSPLYNITQVDAVVVAGDVFPSYERGPYLQKEDLVEHFLPWCRHLGVPVVFTLGNHDYLLPEVIRECISNAGLADTVHLLINEHIIIDGISFYGNPWTTPFCGWNWNAPEDKIAGHLDNMTDTDVFITHGPPAGLCDRVGEAVGNGSAVSESLGSTSIRYAVDTFSPKWTICGHIHTGSHQMEPVGDSDQYVVNVSLRDEGYKAIYKPYTFDVY